jgi:hypothetical protein
MPAHDKHIQRWHQGRMCLAELCLLKAPPDNGHLVTPTVRIGGASGLEDRKIPQPGHAGTKKFTKGSASPQPSNDLASGRSAAKLSTFCSKV